MFRNGQVCFGKVRYVFERTGMFRKGQACLGKVGYV